ncbi:MAG: M28 family metallopeptidase [Trueperaceae bacterium]
MTTKPTDKSTGDSTSADSISAGIEPILEGVSSANLDAHLDWCSGVRRDTGGPGEEKMVEYIVETLKKEGVPVTVHEHDAYLSYPRHAVLEVLAPERLNIRCLTHSFAASTGSNGLSGSLRYLPEKNMKDGAGRIALVDGLAMPIEVLQASRAGVQALIFSNADWYIHNMIVTTIWGGSPTPEQQERLPTVPVVSISNEDGKKLKELLESGPVELRVTTEVETGWKRVKLPEVRIPGSADTDEFVLVGGHYCSWEVGITDNSTGIAALLEIARIMWQNRSSLERNVRVAWWPGHSHGRYAGSTWYADTFFEDLGRNCVAYHNIDSPGVKGATKYILRHTSAEIEEFGRQAIESFTEQRDPEVHRPSRAADQSFLANGIPSCSLYSFLPDGHPDRKPWTGGCAGAWWWHTEHDTRDKADTTILAKDVRLSLGFVARLVNTPLFPFDFHHLALETKEFITDAAEAAEGKLDMDRTLELADQLIAATEGLNERLAASGGQDAARNNETLRRLARTLLPLVFTSDGRYVHEAADITPMMSTHRASMYPGINRAFGLADLEGTVEHGFLLTKLHRQVNRFNDRLERAVELAG